MLEGFSRSPRSIVRANGPRSAVGTSPGFTSPAALLNHLFEHSATGTLPLGNTCGPSNLKRAE